MNDDMTVISDITAPNKTSKQCITIKHSLVCGYYITNAILRHWKTITTYRAFLFIWKQWQQVPYPGSLEYNLIKNHT